MLDNRGAIHLWHRIIHQEEIDWLLFENLQRRGRTIRVPHFMTAVAQDIADKFPHTLLVVAHQYPCGRARVDRGGPRPISYGATCLPARQPKLSLGAFPPSAFNLNGSRRLCSKALHHREA